MLGLLSVLKKYKNTRFSSEMIRKQRKLRGDLVQKSPTPTNGVEPKKIKTILCMIFIFWWLQVESNH